VVGIVALRRLSASHGECEIHAHEQTSDGRVWGGAVLRHISAEASQDGMRIEPGDWGLGRVFFGRTRALYCGRGLLRVRLSGTTLPGGTICL